MEYSESEQAWLIDPPPGRGDLEVLAGGSADAPEPGRLATIGQALPRLGELEAAAVGYLDAFVDRGRFATGGEWSLEGIVCVAPVPADTFTLTFTLDGDVYGWWSVRFGPTLRQHWPVAFGRENY